MTKVFVFAWVLISAAAISVAAETSSWIGFDEGLALAKKENKSIVVDFYTDWCHWCKVMDEKTFHESKVKNKLQQRFVTVRLDAEDEKAVANYRGNAYTNVQLTQAFGVTGFPTLAFLEPDGNIITTVPGYVPAETFIHILEFIDQKVYKTDVSFEDFVKEQDGKL